MIDARLKPGTPVVYHGGWDGKAERCTECGWNCSIRVAATIIEENDGHFLSYDRDTDQMFLHPELFEALAETGSYVFGYPEQFVTK